MKRILAFSLLAFLIGFYTADSGTPKGLQFLVFNIVVIWGSFTAGALFMKHYLRVKDAWKSKPVRILGYEISIRKSNSAREDNNPPLKAVKRSCGLCQDEEEIRIKGTKDTIPCPQCRSSIAQA